MWESKCSIFFEITNMKIMHIGKLRKPITLNKRYQEKSKDRIANDSIDIYMKNIDYRIKPLEELLSILHFLFKS